MGVNEYSCGSAAQEYLKTFIHTRSQGVGFDAYIQTYENIDIPHAVNFYFFKFFKQ